MEIWAGVDLNGLSKYFRRLVYPNSVQDFLWNPMLAEWNNIEKPGHLIGQHASDVCDIVDVASTGMIDT